ncbi:MAG: ribosome biogenesis GTPase Der [Chlamydiae bacterium]|nr:ribosome biogenesis GTPase Der [Chlamydiota bacterium]
MSQVIKIAIVGRPNVGKSAIFNRLCQKRIAIVDAKEGVTRDRIYAQGECFGTPFIAIDTGGIDPHSKATFQKQILQQTEKAIEEADLFVFVVDGHAGPIQLDEEIAKKLHKTNKKIILAVNKIDRLDELHLIHQFHNLAIPTIVGVSALHGFQIAELMETALEGVEADSHEIIPTDSIKVAIVGRPNVGKSTLLNFLFNEERSLVDAKPGTTRDPIDVTISVDGTNFTFIDTAGIRRKKSESDVIDKFAAIRTKEAIERADICLLVVNSLEGITSAEKRIAKEIEELGKGCIVLFNKWDLTHGKRMEHCNLALQDEVAFLQFAPKLFVSAKEGKNLDNLYTLIQEIVQDNSHRISTGQLNKFFEETIRKYHPPMIQGKRLRIYYATQVSTKPPEFVLFVNYPELMLDSYKKYLVNQFRKEHGFQGVALHFKLKMRARRKYMTPAI